MTRGQKIQELLIQILVLWFAFSNIANVSYRPVMNRGFAALAFVIILSGLILHGLNFFKNDAFFTANKLTGSKKLWISFALGIASIVFCLLFGLTSLLYFSPLILAYPVFYFFQHRWLPRGILLMGLICLTYSQMRLTQNDRLHALILWMAKHPERYNNEVLKAFDRKTLTARQAYDVANLLILHPDEAFRDYKTGLEFAQIALKIPTNPLFSKKIAYTLACAMIGEKKIENARKLASTYKIDDLEETLATNSQCEPLPTRAPASIVRPKKYKYYF
jgi:hypothetical protein